MTILQALIQLRDDIKLWCINNFNHKLNKNLGTEESGKFLTVDANGDIVTVASTYTHPTHTAKSSGLYKVTVDGTGHVSGATAVTKSDITALGIPGQDTTYSAADDENYGLIKGGGDVMIEDGIIYILSSSHTHNINNLYTEIDSNKGKVLTTNDSGEVVASSITSVELDYLSNVTSDIQNQLNKKAGEKVAGKVYTETDSATNTTTTFTAGNGAEVFNNYSDNKAIGVNSTAAGEYTSAYGLASYAGGHRSTASNDSAYATGCGTHASGKQSYTEGLYTQARGIASHAAGEYTVADANHQFVVGRYNTIVYGTDYKDFETDAGKTLYPSDTGVFIVGTGTSNEDRKNGFRVAVDGSCYSHDIQISNGADYAEYFEWFDGNVEDEDRRGRFVTLDCNKIRYATFEDDYILGIISATPSVIGDARSEYWDGRYLKDIFGEDIYETVNIPESKDENGVVTAPARIEYRQIINPKYDPNIKYTSREFRKEWDAVGLVGKLVVIDDGTCQVNGYCYPSVDGIATYSKERTNYRVIERLDDTHVRVFIK